MIVNLRRSVVAIIVFTAFFGFVYAFAGTGVAQLFFRHQADGSITADGSTLIGQNWSHLTTFDGTKAYWPSTDWFNGRPDDTGPYSTTNLSVNPVGRGGDNPLAATGLQANGKVADDVSGGSSATNLGPRSKVLETDTEELVAWWHSQGIDPTPDLVTTSGSGIDPDISPQDALVQVPMVSKATGISQAQLRALVNQETNGAQLGFLGSSYVDVLQLNEALAKLK
ncbi:MAG TPA: potassium-transporting ATPase subunit C [Acidimicrobiales bacterium]|nr:potassium-transporting ATPase subunit C [Acidimicrobiales bacterium]